MEKTRLNIRLLSTLSSVLYMRAADMRHTAGIARSTWYDIIARPDTITVQHLLAISNSLHIPVRRFFSTGSTDVVGRRDDYVTEPYAECRYDGEALREMINDRQDATWKRAGEIAGMSYQHIQKSLSSETRTPVVRFLAVCEAFGIDPFTILVDPNPKAVKRGGDGKRDGMLKEISALREDVARLRVDVEKVAEKYEALTAKYDSLLDAHRTLLERFDRHLQEGSAVIAADGPDR